MKNISFWCRYASLGASSRLRFHQFIPTLEASGFKVGLHNFFDNAYLENLYSGKGKSKTAFFSALFRRWRELKQLPPAVPMVIEYELLPFLPFGAENIFLKNRQYILNFDDAVDLRYNKYRFLKNKYPDLISNASGVIVANSELLERFSKYNPRIVKLPTVPPASLPQECAPERGEKLRIGWIGTPVTYKFLLEHAEILQAMYAVEPFELLAIARPELPPVPGIPTINAAWSAETEEKLLRSCHAGIMPLPDTAFTRGKSAFKLIQYLRAGIPAIASAVGENIQVIREGRTGFCAVDKAEWVRAWQQLSRPEVRESMAEDISGTAGEYSFERNAEMLKDFISKTFNMD